MTDRRTFLAGLAGVGLTGLTGCSLNPFRFGSGKIVVIGAGYGGATVAKYLKLFDSSLDVTLIDRDKRYDSCPGSNEVLAGWQNFDSMRRRPDRMGKIHDIRFIGAEVTGIDPRKRRITLDDGNHVEYDRLVVSPGIDFRWKAIEGYDQTTSLLAPHAWKAGIQTRILRKQLKAMKDGGVVIITAPASPYRCPPGPYERASLIAAYLKQSKPKSKVIILDAKTQFSKQKLFLKGWQDLYPGMVEWVSAEKEGKIDRVDVTSKTVLTEFNRHKADVLNVIPPQQAGRIAHLADLVDASGWCPVDPTTFASTRQPHIHVIGDACIATPMPKSAFAANSQAKICARAIVESMQDRDPGPPSLINHCYSFLARDYAISITGVYEMALGKRELVATATGETPMDADRRQEARFARDWQANILADTFL
jgi:sulfide dehydrogenase [flavocytochrome c] flavoprotein subunit